MGEDLKFEVFVAGFYNHGLGVEVSDIISWVIPTGEVKVYEEISDYGGKLSTASLGFYKDLNNPKLFDKFKLCSKKFISNFDGLWNGEIKSCGKFIHFDYLINKEPIILEYYFNSGTKKIVFKINSTKSGYNISYKIFNNEGKEYPGFPVYLKYFGFNSFWKYEKIYNSLKEEPFEKPKQVENLEDIALFLQKAIKDISGDSVGDSSWNSGNKFITINL